MSKFDLWPLTWVSKLTVVTKVAWRFPAEMHIGSHVKYPLLLSDFNQNWNVWTRFSKTPECKISWKSIQPFLETDGWTG
jgi:hypothetical protein